MRLLKDVLQLSGLCSAPAVGNRAEWSKGIVSLMKTLQKISGAPQRLEENESWTAALRSSALQWYESEVAGGIKVFDTRLQSVRARMQEEASQIVTQASVAMLAALKIGEKTSWKVNLKEEAAWDEIFAAAAPMLEATFARNLLSRYETLSKDARGWVVGVCHTWPQRSSQ